VKAAIPLLLDEDVRPLLAEVLRARGFDVIHVLETGRAGKPDAEQLEYATAASSPPISSRLANCCGGCFAV